MFPILSGSVHTGGRRLLGLLVLVAVLWSTPLHSHAQGAIAGQPHFTWQNPLPTGFALNDVHAFSRHSAIVVGDGGAAFRTADGGRTWQTLNVGTFCNLLKVSFGDSLHGWVAYNVPLTNYNTQLYSGRGEVRYTSNGGRTWTRQVLGTTHATYRIKSLQAMSATEAYVTYEYKTCVPNFPCGSLPLQALRHTTNGGQTWNLLTAAYPQCLTPPTLQFVSTTTAYQSVMGAGYVAKSTDSGVTWQPLTIDTSRYTQYSRISFVTPLIGWVTAFKPTGTGQEANLYRTRDGGLTWTRQFVFDSIFGNYPNLQSIAFADTLHGVAIFRSNPYSTVYRKVTNNGGRTWSAQTRLPAWCQEIRLTPDGGGWCTSPGNYGFNAGDYSFNGGYASAAYSPDFGVSWRLLTTAVSGFSMTTPPQFFGAATGWVAPDGDSVLLRTDNRGATWRRVPMTGSGVQWGVNTGVMLRTADFVDADTGYAYMQDYFLGQSRHSVLKTTNGGQSWTRQFLPISPRYLLTTDMRFVTARRGAFVGSGGLILVTQDGGQSWQQPPTGTTARLSRIAWRDSLNAVVMSDTSNGAMKVTTADGGVTWTTASARGITSLRFLQFFTPQIGFASSSSLLNTTDGGNTWGFPALDPPPVPGTPSPVDLALSSVSLTTRHRGLLFGANGWGRTTTSGQTLRYLTTLKDYYGLSCPDMGTAVDDYNAWAVGQGGRILHYSEKYIQTDTAATQRRAYCTGDTLTVAFDTTGVFGPAERNFRLELSNRMGRFRPNETTILIPLGAASASPLRVVLPAGLAGSTRYRVRVIRADSSVLGGDNARDLTIYPRPAAVAVAPADSARICADDSVQLVAPAGYGAYAWSSGAITRTVWVRAAGTYTVAVAQGGGCFGPISRPVTVRVTPRPAAPTVTPQPQLSGIVVLTSSAPAGNQWLFNGQLISGATGPTYAVTTAAQTGTYTVRTTVRGCVSLPSAGQLVTVLGRGTDTEPTNLTLRPNPADAAVRLVSTHPLRTVAVRDLAGRLVMTVAGTGPDVTIPLAALPTGSYMVAATLASGQVLTRRLLVSR